MTEWIYRLYALCPIDEEETINALWGLIAPGPIEAETQTFGVPFSADGREPATYRGISSAATEEMIAVLKELEPEMAGLEYLVQDYDKIEISFTDWIAGLGLKQIIPEELV